MRRFWFVLACFSTASAQTVSDPFLHSLYDRLHDSPMQRKFRALRPMPFGVVFLPWAGMTEQDMRFHFRTMKRLGFHNLKQTLASPEWPQERIMEIALEEDIIPFWYGDAGWDPITPPLLERLGIPPSASLDEIRRDPRMLAHQKEVLRKGITLNSGRSFVGEEEEKWRHSPDPFLRPPDLPHFKSWLRRHYSSPDLLNQAWNLLEPAHVPAPVKSWDDVDRYLDQLAARNSGDSAFGREYGRVLDVLRFKADMRTAQVLARSQAANQALPSAPTRTGGEMGLFLPFAWRATRMEDLAQTQLDYGSFYPSIHFVWHYGEVRYEVTRPIYMQVSFAADLFKGGWTGAWESSGGPQQLSGYKGWDYEEQSTTPGFTVHAGTMTQLFLSYLAGGFRGAGVWTWNYRRAGIEGGEYALLNRQMLPSERAVRAGQIAQAAARLRDELWLAHKEPLAGILVNWDSDALWAAISIRNRDHFRHYPMRARVGVSRALINGNIPWEYVTVDDLRAGLAPRYKVLYLPAQIALSPELLQFLTAYVEQGGRLVVDSPGGYYDHRGKVLETGKGTSFERIFGVELADFQYSNNVPRSLETSRLNGFISDVHPTTARVLARFSTGEPAVTQNQFGKGTAVVLAFDASFASFRPGNTAMEARIRRYALGPYSSPYAASGAIVYRIAAPQADHYFFLNDGPATRVTLTTQYTYTSATDAVTGAKLALGAPIALEPHSGRWLRFAR